MNEGKKDITLSSLLYVVLVTLMVVVVIFSYYKYAVKGDFFLYAQVTCDPNLESCFVWECDPEEDEFCSDEPEEQVWYYKIVYKPAINAPQCDPTSGDGCPELSCDPGEILCDVIYCNSESASLYQVGDVCW